MKLFVGNTYFWYFDFQLGSFIFITILLIVLESQNLRRILAFYFITRIYNYIVIIIYIYLYCIFIILRLYVSFIIINVKFIRFYQYITDGL